MENNIKSYRLYLTFCIATFLMLITGCWTKTYEYNCSIVSVKQTGDSGYIAAGVRLDEGLNSYLVKTNSSGDVLWQKYDSGNIIENTLDNGFIISGHGFGIQKLDSQGNVQWSDFDCNFSYAFQLDDGSFSAFKIKDSNFNLNLSSINTDGSIDHEVNVSLPQNYHFYSNLIMFAPPIIKTNDSGFIFLAENCNAGTCKYLLIKINNEGVIEWESGIEIENGYFLYSAYIYQNPGNEDFVLLLSQMHTQTYKYINCLYRVDKSGNASKIQDFASKNADLICFSVSQLKNGGYIIAGGEFPQNTNYQKGVLIKTDQTGKELWKRYSVLNNGWASVVNETKDGMFVVGGILCNKEMYYSAWLSKTDMFGFAPTI
jgi:hypothetical protein